MKKNLILTAALAAFSPFVFAQSSAVSLYGVVDAAVSVVDDGTSRTVGVDSGGNSGSRVGFKGHEALGDGWGVNFVLESGVNIDTGGNAQGNTAFGRQAWVGLQKEQFGSVKLGLQYTPLRSAVESVDPFALGMAGNALKTLGAGGYQERVKNSISYTTPIYSGFSGQIAYGFGETAGNTKDGRMVGASVGYKTGPATAVLAVNNLNGTQGASDVQDVFLGGTYDFKVVKAHAAAAHRKVDSAVADFKVKNYMLGVSKEMGPHKVMASYIRNDVSHIADADSNGYALGYSYTLSPRTMVYTSYGHYSNDSLANLNVARAGDTGSQLNAGIRHIF